MEYSSKIGRRWGREEYWDGVTARRHAFLGIGAAERARHRRAGDSEHLGDIALKNRAGASVPVSGTGAPRPTLQSVHACGGKEHLQQEPKGLFQDMNLLSRIHPSLDR